MSKKELTLTEAAELLNLSPQHTSVLIRAGKLPARRWGRSYVIEAKDVENFRRPKRGRPPRTPDSKPRKPRKAKAGPIEEGEEKR